MPPCDFCSKGPWMAWFLKTGAFQCHKYSTTGHNPFQSPCTNLPAPSWLLESLVFQLLWEQLRQHIGELKLGAGAKAQTWNLVLEQLEFQVKPVRKEIYYKALLFFTFCYTTSFCLSVNSHLHVAHCMSQNIHTVLWALLIFLCSLGATAGSG